MVSVTVWNEYVHEQEDEAVAEVYPDGIHATIADALADRGHETRTATLQEPEHGLTESVLDDTEVLTWWGHAAHDEVDDEIVERVAARVRDGMGLLVLHSAHASKPFQRLLGTPCDLTWREAGERERCWVVDPGHPITDGLDDSIVIEEAEMYGEPFGVPEPDRLVFTSWFEGGEVFRSGCCYRRGRGKVFYFRPGHETYPIYHRDDVQRVLGNAVEWAAPTEGADAHAGNRNVEPRESI
ncbi:ThuA domain-containing protein [Halomicroarcula sp. GCM10025709]|uniref:ThuA domain-containing protein n=1 Tax=Haloarcula TaxID=2237 RepID=UPI0024C27B2C|nr:ThuA domain-containing protein [Halomicroarcula sp. YJ-61-S]